MSDREKESAKALSKLGASKGGRARAAKLTSEERSASARKAVLTRWVKEGKTPKIAQALYGAADKPLRIGEIEMPCYVLADGRRVFSQRGLQAALGLSEGGGRGGARKLVQFMEALERKGIDTKGLTVRADSPIRFIPPQGGNPADGYEATILPDLCAVILDARAKNALDARLDHVADRCAILQNGFATVGIIALVDEATGYQYFRARDALALILEKFIARELQPWVRTFPPEFYEQIFRLRGWGPYIDGRGSPGVVAYWTNDIVYRRLAPNVLEVLRAKTPRSESGRLKNRLFQWLTDDIGHPKLREHLAGVVMLMKYSPDWNEFMNRLNREYPPYDETLPLPFPEDIVREATTPALPSVVPSSLVAPSAE